MRNQTVGEVVADLRRAPGELRWEGELPTAESGDADRLAEGGVSAAEGEIGEPERRRRRGEGEGVLVELGDEAAVAVGVVERRAREFLAVADFDGLEGALGHGAEVGGGEGVVDGGAGRGLAGGRGGGGGEVEGARVGDGGGGVFAVAEDAVEGVAGEPNDVAAGVHVEGDGLGAQGEGEGIVGAGGEREGYAAAVVAEAGGGAGGGGFEEVRGGVEEGGGKGV